MNKPAKITVISTTMSFLLSACATTTPIVDLQNAPRDREIEIITHSGNLFRFNQWQVDSNGAIIGFTKTTDWRLSDSLDKRVVPADSIKSLSLVDSKAEAIQLSAFVIGATAAGALMFWFIMNFLNTLFGRRVVLNPSARAS